MTIQWTDGFIVGLWCSLSGALTSPGSDAGFTEAKRTKNYHSRSVVVGVFGLLPVIQVRVNENFGDVAKIPRRSSSSEALSHCAAGLSHLLGLAALPVHQPAGVPPQ